MRRDFKCFTLTSLYLSLSAALLLIGSSPCLADSLAAKWKNGIRLQNEDGTVKIKLGGRIMNDYTFWLDADKELEDEETGVGKLEDGTEFRRARLYAAGSVHNLEFKANYDFAGGDSDFKDVYVGITKVPVLDKVRVGHQYEPFGLEEMTSSKYITFIERGLVTAFTPGRNNGIRVLKACPDGMGTFSFGAYKETDDFGEGEGDDNLNFTARATLNPLYEEDGRKLVHAGIAYSYKNLDKDEIRFRERPEIHDSPRFVDTGSIAADSAHLVGAELAFVAGPFSLQGEYQAAFTETDQGSDSDFGGFYAFASFFLTGENRAYKQKDGVFDRVHPNSDYISSDPGSGAWELAARISGLDLNDGEVRGGELTNFTAGLNWYMHPNARVMLNFIHADEDTLGDAQAITTRFQVDF